MDQIESALTIQELAEFEKSSPAKIRDLVVYGEYPGAYRHGGSWRIPWEAVAKHRENNAVKAVSE